MSQVSGLMNGMHGIQCNKTITRAGPLKEEDKEKEQLVLSIGVPSPFPTALGSRPSTHAWLSIFRVLRCLESLFNTGFYIEYY